MRIRVIGIGSSFAADQTGWRAVADLKNLPDLISANIDWVTLDRPGAGLIRYLDESIAVLVLDACIARNQQIGATLLLPASDFSDQVGMWGASHGIGLGEALSLACSLGVNLSNVSLALLNVPEPESLALSWVAPEGFCGYLTAVYEKINALIQD